MLSAKMVAILTRGYELICVVVAAGGCLTSGLNSTVIQGAPRCLQGCHTISETHGHQFWHRRAQITLNIWQASTYQFWKACEV